MKICLNFPTCHLAKAWSSCSAVWQMIRSTVRQSQGSPGCLLYCVLGSLLCCWQPRLRKETTLVSGVEMPGPVWQGLTKQRSFCCYHWNVNSPQLSSQEKDRHAGKDLMPYNESLYQPLTQDLANGVFSINVCWMNESMNISPIQTYLLCPFFLSSCQKKDWINLMIWW